jgi:hypothetical protein
VDVGFLVSVLLLLELLVEERNRAVAGRFEVNSSAFWSFACSYPSTFSGVGRGDFDDELSSSIDDEVEKG